MLPAGLTRRRRKNAMHIIEAQRTRAIFVVGPTSICKRKLRTVFDDVGFWKHSFSLIDTNHFCGSPRFGLKSLRLCVRLLLATRKAILKELFSHAEPQRRRGLKQVPVKNVFKQSTIYPLPNPSSVTMARTVMLPKLITSPNQPECRQ